MNKDIMRRRRDWHWLARPIDQLIRSGRTVVEISKIFDVTPTVIQRQMRRFKIDGPRARRREAIGRGLK